MEKGRLLLNRPLFVDTLYYGSIIAALSLANFAVVAYLDGPGVANTRNCNYELVRARLRPRIRSLNHHHPPPAHAPAHSVTKTDAPHHAQRRPSASTSFARAGPPSPA